MDYDCNCITKISNPSRGYTQHIFCEMHQTAESLLRGTAMQIEAQTGTKPALNEIIPTMKSSTVLIAEVVEP